MEVDHQFLFGIPVHTTEFLPKDTVVLMPKVTVREVVNHTWEFEYDPKGMLVIRGIGPWK